MTDAATPDAPEVPTVTAEPAPAAIEPPAATPAVMLVADAGYSSANDAITCETLGFVPVFPVLRTVNPHGQFFNRTDFEHDALRDLMICPAGKELEPLPKPEDGGIRYKAQKADCGGCELKSRCTTAKKRTVVRLINEPALNRVAERLKAAPDLMAKRAQSVEPAFGTLKRWLPIFRLEKRGGRFLLRGRDKARTELGLLALAFNLNRLTNLHGATKMQEALA